MAQNNDSSTHLVIQRDDTARTHSNRWRLAAATLKLWPDQPPQASTYHHGWVHRGNERLLRRLICEHRPRVIVELGSWLGLCTTLLLEASEAYGAAAVFAVDRWDGRWLLEQQPAQYERDEEAYSLLTHGDGGGDGAALPLFETFLANMWEHRTRLFPLRMDTLEGIEAVRALGAPVDLVYIDADHSKAAVLGDVRAAAAAFPQALLVGDDWQWPEVRAAIEEHAAECSCRVEAHANENWWRLVPCQSVQPGQAASASIHACSEGAGEAARQPSSEHRMASADAEGVERVIQFERAGVFSQGARLDEIEGGKH